MPKPQDIFDPFKLAAASIGMWTDLARLAQQQAVQTTGMLAGQITPDMIEWKTIEVPVLSKQALSSSGALEDHFGKAFQASADMNLTTWTHIANTLAALPAWAHWPTEIPGRALTDYFDKMKPRPAKAANSK